MSEMLDRVARALCDFDIGKDAWDYTGQHECRDDYRALARIAIKAMREPTRSMINSDLLPYSPGEMLDYWQIMIDVTLAPSDRANADVGK